MSTFNDPDSAPNGICTKQPQAKIVLGSKESIYTLPVERTCLQHYYDEEHYQCKHGQTSPPEHRHCHNIRLRRLILPALLVLLALGGLLAINWHGWSTWGVDSLAGRDFNDTILGNGTTSGNGTTFKDELKGVVNSSSFQIGVSVGGFVFLLVILILPLWGCRKYVNSHRCLCGICLLVECCVCSEGCKECMAETGPDLCSIILAGILMCGQACG